MKITRDTLFMNYPSSWWHDLWREGIVSGNGEIGINIYGGNKNETMIINHHDLWYGGKKETVPNVKEAFTKLRDKMNCGDFKEANWVLVNALKEKNYESKLEAPLPLCDFKVIFNKSNGFTKYLRGMQLNTGEISAEWEDKNSSYCSKQFVSRADNMIVKEISSNNELMDVHLDLDVHINIGSKIEPKEYSFILKSMKRNVEEEFLSYSAINDDGLSFGAVARIIAEEGEIIENKDRIQVKNSKRILIFLKCFIKSQDADKSISNLKSSLLSFVPNYHYYLDKHKLMHEKLFNSAELELPYESFNSNEELLLQAYKGKISAEFIEKLWKFGRYLFISGTSESSNPFCLYGLWGGDYNLQWSHNMSNINLQMMYWHTLTGNLVDFNKAICSYFNKKLDIFKENSKKIFGMRGIYIPAGTTPNISEPTQIVPVIINWVHAAGWIAQHYYNLNLFLNNSDYLKEEILPYLLEVASFYEDFIEFTDDDTIKLYPSISPENTPGNYMPHHGKFIPHPMPTTINSTIDVAIIKEFFCNMLKIAENISISKKRVNLWKKILNSIPKYQINSEGGVKEWQSNLFTERYDHRHLSHLYPVFPGTEVNEFHERELLPAFEKAVDLRVIDTQTGWSMSVMAAIYARLNNSEKASESILNLVRSSMMSNFLTLHNDWRGMNISWDTDPSPVQLDANMGLVNAIQEMIFYSSEQAIKLLPALSPAMNIGKIKNFRYAHGLVKMEWNINKKKFKCIIKALRPHEILIKLPDILQDTPYIITNYNCVFEDDKYVKINFGSDGYLEIFSENFDSH